MIASTFALGTTQTFPSEAQAFKAYPQIVIALKSQIHRFRRLGIAPIAAAGQFGAPLGPRRPRARVAAVPAAPAAAAAAAAAAERRRRRSGRRRRSRRTGGGGTSLGGFNNADNSSLGDVNGMALPAILNEVISVTGTYPFPFTTSPSTTPTDPSIGVIPNPLGPVLVFGNNLTIGGTAGTGTGGGGAGGGAEPVAAEAAEPVAAVAVAAATGTTGVSANVTASRRPTSPSITTGSWARSTAASRPTSRPRRSTSRPSAAPSR